MQLEQLRDRAPAFPGYFAATTRCPQCSEKMIAPVMSLFVEAGKIRHLWHCDTCAHVFSTDVSLSRD